MTVKTTAKIPDSQREGRPIASHGETFPDRGSYIDHGDKMTFSRVEGELGKLEKKLNQFKTKASANRYIASPRYKNIKAILNSVSDAIKGLEDVISTGNIKAADDAIWRATVSLQTLDHLMACVSR
eukprot:1389043-Amorphochlora_amoeboformis.AAC.1